MDDSVQTEVNQGQVVDQLTNRSDQMTNSDLPHVTPVNSQATPINQYLQSFYRHLNQYNTQYIHFQYKLNAILCLFQLTFFLIFVLIYLVEDLPHIFKQQSSSQLKYFVVCNMILMPLESIFYSTASYKQNSSWKIYLIALSHQLLLSSVLFAWGFWVSYDQSNGNENVTTRSNNPAKQKATTPNGSPIQGARADQFPQITTAEEDNQTQLATKIEILLWFRLSYFILIISQAVSSLVLLFTMKVGRYILAKYFSWGEPGQSFEQEVTEIIHEWIEGRSREYSDGGNAHEEVEGCSVCLEQFKEGERVVELKCSERHVFHTECLKQWIRVKRLCPLCRSNVWLQVTKKE